VASSSNHEHSVLASFRVDERNEEAEWVHFSCEDPTCEWNFNYHSDKLQCNDQVTDLEEYLTDAKNRSKRNTTRGDNAPQGIRQPSLWDEDAL